VAPPADEAVRVAVTVPSTPGAPSTLTVWSLSARSTSVKSIVPDVLIVPVSTFEPNSVTPASTVSTARTGASLVPVIRMSTSWSAVAPWLSVTRIV